MASNFPTDVRVASQTYVLQHIFIMQPGETFHYHTNAESNERHARSYVKSLHQKIYLDKRNRISEQNG